MSESNSNKQWKRVPFDIELAKKIQSGEVEGRIVAKGVYDGETVKESEIREIRFDIKCKSYPIAAIYEGNFGEETVGQFDKDGINSNPYLHKLFIELPEEALKHEFKPFDKVLVRAGDGFWMARLYDRFFLDKHWCQDGLCWKECIPYAGHEHLVGTTNNP